MPLEFLRDIAASTLPLHVTDEVSIDKLRVLAAAGMVTAMLPEPGTPGSAVVSGITGLGRASLRLRNLPAPAPPYRG